MFYALSESCDCTFLKFSALLSGEYFSSGADLKNTNMIPDDDETTQPTFMKPAGRFMVAMLHFPKLICAAVNGPAVGIGVTLLLHCDLCFCTKNATFWTPFTRIALGKTLCIYL